jgi:hypothetical protein
MFPKWVITLIARNSSAKAMLALTIGHGLIVNSLMYHCALLSSVL